MSKPVADVVISGSCPPPQEFVDRARGFIDLRVCLPMRTPRSDALIAELAREFQSIAEAAKAQERAENGRLREALERISNYKPPSDVYFDGDWEIYQNIAAMRGEIAREALSQSTPPHDLVCVPRELIKDILGSGIEWDPPTKSYLVMQISRDTLTELRAALGAAT